MFLHGSAATPVHLINKMIEQKSRLKNVELISITQQGVHWVVTEYGAVNLFGMNMEQRAKALIKIAHPNHQETLEKEACKRFE